MAAELAAWALKYARHGWPVFPCKERGKEPLTHDGFKSATTDVAQITKWWTIWPLANIACVPAQTGHIVIDIDGPEGEATAQALGLLSEPTLTVTTDRGWHLWFKHPGGHIGIVKLAPQLEARSTGGYVMLPPSVHPSGAVYRGHGKPSEILPLPPDVLTKLTNGGRPKVAAPLPERITDGMRNATLTSLAGTMRRRGSSAQAILAALEVENATRCVPPLTAAELGRIAHGIAERYTPAPPHPEPAKEATEVPGPSTPLTPWGHAQSAPEFLATVEPDVAFLKPRLLVAGGVTFLFSPRGLGKTHIGHALAVELAHEGLRVLLMDRDNPDREFHRRLQGWAAETAPTLKVMSRRHAPALTDALAWASFPLTDYDVLILDSLDSFTEGVGEQDSSRVSRALATLLDIVRRPDGPAVLIPGNTVKSAAHSRGSGVVEDRADIVYEVRDATDLKPTGTKAWWEELAPAGAEAWAQRAGRRKRRTSYRLALVPSKFRVGSEPDPFVLEVNLAGVPWTLRDVTDELLHAEEQALAEAAAATKAQLDAAASVLRAAVEHGARPDRTTAIALLMEEGLTRDAARNLINTREGTDWHTVEMKDQKGKPRVLTPVEGVEAAAAEIPPRDNPDGTRANEGHFGGASDTKGPLKCHEIGQTLQGFPEEGISAAGSNYPPTCPRGHRLIGGLCPECDDA